MSKILILRGDRFPDDNSFAYWMAHELNNIGLDQYEVRKYSDLVFSTKSKESHIWFASDGTELVDYDLVYMRDLFEYQIEQNLCAIYLESKGKKFINHSILEYKNRSKIAQYMQLSLCNCTIPNTLFAQRDIIHEQYKKQGFDFPFILKSITGYAGHFNFLIHNEDELLQKLNEIQNHQFIIQEFIPNEGDYRVVVFNDDILCAYHRQRLNDETHLNNVTQGAKRTLASLSSEASSLAIKAAKQLDNNLSGVDVIIDKNTNQAYILEVNANFGMYYFKDGIEDAFYSAISKKLNQLAK